MRCRVAAFTTFCLLLATGLDGYDEPIAGWFDLRVPGGAPTLAALGIPVEERAYALPVLSHALHSHDTRIGLSPDDISSTLGLVSSAANTPGASDSITIPTPLDEDTWRRLLELAPREDLFLRFLTDRNALLLAAGLMAADGSVRALMARDRDLLRSLYREAAGAFLVVSRCLRIEGDRIVVPGGTGADDIWRRLSGSTPSQPSAFIRSLVTRDQGRLAWYYDTIAGMDDTRLAVAWSSTSPAGRLDSASALYETFREREAQLNLNEHPFRRGYGDAWSIVMLTEVTQGRLVGPSTKAFWDLVLSDNSDHSRLTRDNAPLSMAHLARTTVGRTFRERRLRFETFRLAQRVFPNPAPADFTEIATALSGYGEYRTLLLALERMHITSAITWAGIVRAARHVTKDADDKRESIAAFQGAVALIERVRHLGTIDGATAERVLTALSLAVRRHSRVSESIADWITTSFVPALPRLERPDAWTGKTAFESTILQALAGPRDQVTPSLEWEGLTYRVDLVAAEHERLRAVRTQIPSPGLDLALESRQPRELASALVALVYASALGEPEGAVALSRDVATRHDLGLSATPLIRDERPWSPPEERQDTGPWRVQGSLIGLDLGLSRLALRRLGDQTMPLAPKLTINDLGTLTRTIVALVPSELTDPDRDELAAAIARGRQRVADAAVAVPALDALASEAGMSAVTRQLLPWLAAREPGSLAHIFALRDLMWLGRPTLSKQQLDRWGVSADGIDGRRTTAMPGPVPWEDFSGRPEAGQMMTQVPDLTLRIVEETARLKIPAVLIPSLLGFAVADYWHDVQVRFADDWLAMTRQARALDASRIEDYVAALTGNGPLRAQ